MIHITQACVDLLAAAINECDAMMLAEDRRNDIERSHSHSHSRMADSVRVPHHSERRKTIRDHRIKLVELFVKITGKDPWANVPF